MPPSRIIGHKKQVLQLTQDLTSGNLSHAYLFTGKPHLGKTTVAHWFARQLLLREVAPEKQEEALNRMDKLIHPDLLVLDQLWMDGRCDDWNVIAQSSNMPQQHRAKAKMKTDVISIDDVREIQDRLYETGELRHRVCIIRGIERMQDAAANAFLKILEEPPPGRIFLLTSETPSALLSTITSRARVLRFDRVGQTEVQHMLTDIPEEDASFILHVAEGAPGLAVNLMRDPELLRAEKLHHTQAASFWGARTLLDRLNQLEPLSERGDEADRFLFHLALALREVPDYRPEQERELTLLAKDLRTNASRGLLVQRFAMNVEK